MHNPSIYLFTYKKNYLHSYQNICCQKRIDLRDDADLSIINFHEDFFKANNDVLRVFFPTHSLWSVGHRFGQSHWEIQSSRASNDDVGFSGFSAFATRTVLNVWFRVRIGDDRVLVIPTQVLGFRVCTRLHH